MGKRKRRSSQPGLTQTGDSNATAGAPTKPPFVPVPPELRCVLTGAPIDLVGLQQRTTRLRVLPTSQSTILGTPTRIHSRVPWHDQDGGVGAHTVNGGSNMWSPDFERFIKPALPSSLVAAKRAWEEWWTLPIIVLRLTSAMGPERARAALLYWRDKEAVESIASQTHHSVNWVWRQKMRSVQLVRRRWLPYELLTKYLASFAESFEPLPEAPTAQKVERLAFTS